MGTWEKPGGGREDKGWVWRKSGARGVSRVREWVGFRIKRVMGRWGGGMAGSWEGSGVREVGGGGASREGEAEPKTVAVNGEGERGGVREGAEARVGTRS